MRILARVPLPRCDFAGSSESAAALASQLGFAGEALGLHAEPPPPAEVCNERSLVRWWQSWLDYVNHDMNSTVSNGYGSHNYESPSSSSPKRPFAIDNSDLVNEATIEISYVDIELHETLVEGRDYILLPQEVWDRLLGW
ncbi:Ubiquitin carboxyl-terminal hydrolase 5 [Platanthera zijinensis]|uniref:Ubiquitin carboxyl-terminal hydrolase 5 n=1 Tax=Platanthera zijinensis TaxID=2320716 RepID=A0AAP0GAP0_9ASPA